MSHCYGKIMSIFLVICIGLICSSMINPVDAATIIGNEPITYHPTWTKEGSPYIVENLTIDTGSSLTIEAGTIVLFKRGSITVNGSIIINGTQESSVVFTSYYDTQHGGYTGGSPSNYQWYGIFISNTGTMECTFGEFYFGGETKNNRSGMVLVDGQASLADCKFGYYSNSAIDVTNELKAIRTEFGNVTQGLSGINGYGKLTIQSCIFNKNRFGMTITDIGQTVFSDSYGNVFNGNLFDVVKIGISATKEPKEIVLPNIGAAYYVEGSLEIPENYTVTFNPGAHIKFSAKSSIIVNGTLIIRGTQITPNIISSVYDNLHGGNSCSSGGSPSNNQWSAIFVSSIGKLECTFAEFYYGGEPLNSRSGMIQIDGQGSVCDCQFSLYNESAIDVRNKPDPEKKLKVIRTKFDNGTQGIIGYGALTVQSCEFNNSRFAMNLIDIGETKLVDSYGNIFNNNIFNVVKIGILSTEGTKETTEGTKEIILPNLGVAYYIDGNLEIPEHYTVTFNPGAHIKFETKSSITVMGNLKINGTETSHNVISSVYDNLNGGSSYIYSGAPISHEWCGILIANTGTMECTFGEFYYGGETWDKRSAMILVDGQGSFYNCKFRCYSNSAIEVTNKLKAIQTEFSNGFQGLCGINGYGTLTVKRCIFSNNRLGMNITDIGRTEFIDSYENNFVSNIFNVIKIASISTEGKKEITLPNLGGAYYVDINNLEIPEKYTVTFSAGAHIKFHYQACITVKGTLKIAGTQSASNILSSVYDNLHGGTSVGSSSPAPPGSQLWSGFIVTDKGTLDCTFGDFYYGGLGGNNSYIQNTAIVVVRDCRFYNATNTAISNKGELTATRILIDDSPKGIVNSGNAVVKSSLFSNNQSAICLSGGEIQITGTDFVTNTIGIQQDNITTTYIRSNNFIGNTYAVKNNIQSTMDCAWNFWNHESGPSTYSSKGWTSFGDRIQGLITFEPWFSTKQEGKVKPAVIEVKGISNGERTNKSPVIVITVTDGEIRQILMDDKPWSPGDAIVEGSHKLIVTAENFDREGQQVEIDFSFDITPPEAVIDNGEIIRALLSSGPITFTANGSKDNAIIEEYNWSFTDGTVYTTKTPTLTKKFIEEGDYTLTLVVTDNHGNKSLPVTARVSIEDVKITVTGVQDGQKSCSDYQIGVSVSSGKISEIKLDQNLITEQNFNVTTEGKHVLAISVASELGTVTTKTIGFSLDKTPPVAKLGNDLYVYQSEKVVVSGSMSTDNMGIAEYHWNIADPQGGTIEPSSNQGLILTITDGFKAAGDYKVTLQVKDEHGLWCNIPASLIVHVSYRPVKVEFPGMTNDERTNKSKTLQAKISYGTIKSMKLMGSTVKDGVTDVTNGTVVSDDGDYTFEVVATNQNQEDRTFSICFSIDKTPPVAIIERSTSTQGFSDNVPVTFRVGYCTDNTGIDKYEWTLLDLQTQGIIKTATTVKDNISFNFTTAGNYKLALVAIDGYGNRSTQDSVEFTIKEKGKTEIIFNGIDNQGRSNTAVTVQVAVTDGQLQRLTLDGQALTTDTVNVSADGAHSLVAEAGDEQGYHLSKTLTFSIDTTPPIAKAGPDLDLNEGDTLTITGGGEDLNGINEYKWSFQKDGQNQPIESTGQKLTQADLTMGIYTAELMVKDSFGNWSLKADQAKIYVHAKPVKLTIEGIKPNERVNRDVKITGSDTDLNSDVQTVVVKISADQNGSIQSVTLKGNDGSKKICNLDDITTITKDGRYTLEIVVSNSAQEVSSASLVFTIDKTAPTAEAGPDQKCFNDDEPVTYDGTGSMDNLGIGIFEWKFPHGETVYGPIVHKSFNDYSPGTYTISLKVTDLAGNESGSDQCLVTVADKGNTSINITGIEKERYNGDVTVGVDVSNGTLQSFLIDGVNYNESQVTLTQDGRHEILVTTMNEQGYSMTKRGLVEIDKTPPVPDGGGDKKIYSGQKVYLDAGFSKDNHRIVKYRWEFSDGSIVENRCAEHVFEEPGTYQVGLMAQDDFGNWSLKPDSVTITVLDSGTLSVLDLNVTDQNGLGLPGTIAVIENSAGEQLKLLTGTGGRLSQLLEPGEYQIYLYRPGYKSQKKLVTIAEQATVEENFTLVAGSDIVAVTESRQLDYNEIRSLGIDTSQPDNRLVYKFELRLEYMEVPFDISIIRNVKQIVQQTVKPAKKPEEQQKQENPNCDIHISEGTEPGIMAICIQGTASVLKEFHEISVILVNGADPTVSLDDTVLQLKLQDGLSLAPIPEEHQTSSGDTILQQSNTVNAGKIPGQTQKRIKWILRGDKGGTYTPEITYSGTLNPFGVKVMDTVKPDKPITISDPAKLALKAEAPDLIYRNQSFTVKLHLINESDKPYYDAVLKVDNVNMEGNVTLLSKLDGLVATKDCLGPGEQLTVSIDFLPSVSGICELKNLSHIGGNASFSTGIIPEGPNFLTAKTGDGSVLLSWVESADGLYYIIRRRKAGEQELTIIDNGCYGSEYEDKNLDNFQMYEYTISAVNFDYAESAQSQVIEAMPGSITASDEQRRHPNPFSLTLSAGSQNGIVIYYTTDGTDPVPGESDVYSEPINIYNNTIVKAIAVNGQGVSKIYEFMYFIENAINGPFVQGKWSEFGSNHAVRQNQGEQYTLTLPGTEIFDWSAGNPSPAYLREMPEGNWTVETSVNLKSFKDGSNFSSGMLIKVDDQLISWGYYQGVNLAIAGVGETPKKLAYGQPIVSLRIRKEGNTYYFEYRGSMEEPWHIAGNRILNGASCRVGVTSRTWKAANGLTSLFSGFTITLEPTLDPVWEWIRPVEGPECHPLSVNSFSITLPDTRVFNRNTKTDSTPRLVRKDLAAGDWRLSTVIDFKGHSGNSSFFTGVVLHLGTNNGIYWGREGDQLVVRHFSKGILFSVDEAPVGAIQVQVQKTGYHYLFSYRLPGSPRWEALGVWDTNEAVADLGFSTRTWDNPQQVETTFSQIVFEKILPKLSQDWSWYSGNSATTYRVLSSDGVAISVKGNTFYDDSGAQHRTSRLQRETGSSDWQAEVKVTPKSASNEQYWAGLQVLFGENDRVSFGISGSKSLTLQHACESITTIPIDQPVSIHVQKTGNSFSFAYRYSETESWTEAGTCDIAVCPKYLAAVVKTSAPVAADIGFTELKFMRTLPKYWEFYAPVNGPDYNVTSDNTIQLAVPGDRSYINTSEVDAAPQIRVDLAAINMNEDWSIHTRVRLDTYSDGTNFQSGLMVYFGSQSILRWGLKNGKQIQANLDGKGFAHLSFAGKDVDLQIRKIGSTYYFEYRNDPNDSWQAAGQTEITAKPLKVGLITETSSKCRVETSFAAPEIIKVTPRYDLEIHIKNALWGMEVSQASISIDQSTARPVSSPLTLSLDKGTHQVKVESPGYQSYSASVELEADQVLEIPLVPTAEQPVVTIDSVVPKIDKVSDQLILGFTITNTGVDSKVWVNVSLLGQDNKVLAVLGGQLTLPAGQQVDFKSSDYVFKLPSPASLIRVEIRAGNSQGALIAQCETPIGGEGQ